MHGPVKIAVNVVIPIFSTCFAISLKRKWDSTANGKMNFGLEITQMLKVTGIVNFVITSLYFCVHYQIIKLKHNSLYYLSRENK